MKMPRPAIALLAMAATAAGCGSTVLEANAGEDIQVEVGGSPSFDGCGSTGDIVNYEWVISDAPTDLAGDVGKALRETDDGCAFTLDAPMLAEEVGDWTIMLTVTDGDGGESSDEVMVTVG